ncbi:unnamed protein product [Pleuronectes platessa]|uniref:Uncharacterized protein n=1 Tax=Pleuronectes platessa TaxID=8262 RepID=A0A9N7Y6Y7_PLEPL|nr:unnamed protein product [Pleuronectes platessa]
MERYVYSELNSAQLLVVEQQDWQTSLWEDNAIQTPSCSSWAHRQRPLQAHVTCCPTDHQVEDPLLFTLLLDSDFIQELGRRRRNSECECDPPEKIQRAEELSVRSEELQSAGGGGPPAGQASPQQTAKPHAPSESLRGMLGTPVAHTLKPEQCRSC